MAPARARSTVLTCRRSILEGAESSQRKILPLPPSLRDRNRPGARDFESAVDPRAVRSRYLRIINMTVQYLKNLSFLCNLHIQIQVYSRNVQWFIALTSLTSRGTATAE